MHRTGPRLLLTDRDTALFLERARVRCDGDRLVYTMAEDGVRTSYNLPHINTAVLYLGQGTSITQEAARKLGEEGVFVAFVGSGGAPLHYGSLTNYQASKWLDRAYRIFSCPHRSLAAARMAMLLRAEMVQRAFVDTLQNPPTTSSATPAPRLRIDAHIPVPTSPLHAQVADICASLIQHTQQAPNIPTLLGQEAHYAKRLYQTAAQHANVAFTRTPGAQKKDSQADRINSRLDHGNYLAYGIAGAVLWTLGIPASLSFFHGKTRNGGLVFDLADVFKDAIVLPLAFHDWESESAFRSAVIRTLHDRAILALCFAAITRMIDAGEQADIPVPPYG